MEEPLRTNVQFNDIPEYLRDYRSALLNAVFGTVFTRPYLKEQLPRALFAPLENQAAPPPQTSIPPDAAAAAGSTEPSLEQQGITATLSRSSRMPNLLGLVWDPKTRTFIPEAYREVVTRGIGMSNGGKVGDDIIDQILKSYENLRKAMPIGLNPDLYDYSPTSKSTTKSTTATPPPTVKGGVTAPGSTNPFGDFRKPSQTSAYTTGTDFGTDLERFNKAPDITLGVAPPISTGVTPPPPPPIRPSGGGTGGKSLGVGTGGTSGGTGGRTGGGTGGGTGGIGGGTGGGTGGQVLPRYSPGAAGTTQTPAGYNPNQYLNDARSKGLATLLGGSVVSTNTEGPNAPPSQNMIDLGGSDAFNAGLVQQQLRPGQTPSEMTSSLNMLRADISRSGGNTSAIDRMIEENNRAYASGAMTSPVGFGSSNTSSTASSPVAATRGRMADDTSRGGRGIGRNSTSSSERSTPAEERLVYQPEVESSYEPQVESFYDDGVSGWLEDIEQKPAVPYYGRGFASGGSLARFEIGDNGRVKNYRRGGAIRASDGLGPAAGPNISGFGAVSPPAGGTGIQNLFGARTGTTGMQIFNPPPVYGSQRIMQFGSPQQFGQYDPNFGFTASNLTRKALSGTGDLPSVFTPEGQINMEGTDFGKGVKSINFATDISGEGADFGRKLMYNTFGAGSQPSYLMSQMPNIQRMGFQGPIKIDPLMAPTLASPTGVTAPNLKDYQIALPQGVSGESIDILGQLGGINAAKVEGFPQVQQFQMSPAERVAAGQTQVGTFGQPQAQQYMSPYMDAVTDAQKREATRQAAMQKAGRSAAAVRSGAFGGSRQAIQEGLAEEALQRQLGEIEAVGKQRAFENAQAQFERDRAASLASQQANVQSALQAALANQQAGVTTGRENLGALLATQQLGTQSGLQAALANQQAAQQAGLTRYGTTADILRGQSAQNLQAALANQQAGLTGARENLAARLGTQQLGAQQSLQAQLANQQAGLTAGQANLQSALATQQLGTQAGLEAAKASQSGDLATWQMQLDAMKQASAEQEAARQRDFQNRLASIQQTQAGAAGLAGLGSTMMNIPGMAQQLELQRLAAMQQAGGAIDARTQQALDMAYQDFINQQNFPYQQMNFLQGILGGVPTGMQVEGVQFQRPAGGGLSGLISAGGGLLLNQLNR